MNPFIENLSESVTRGTFVHLVLSSPVKTNEPNVQKVTVRPLEIQGQLRYQVTRHETARETHTNWDAAELALEIGTLLGSHFRHAHLFTTLADITAKMKASGKLKMSSRAPSKDMSVRTHNRTKKYLIPDGAPCAFLEEIGVMNAEGRVYAAKYDKFKQINRFLEFIDDIYSTLPADSALRVIDFGCGKSYLTFAIHHLLVNIHGREVDLLGVDLKTEVIERCQAIGERLKCEGLRFQAGDVRDITPGGPVDLVVSLHACDTATDVALAKAVHWEAGVILSVPCCHHEFASSMSEGPLPSLQCHGILRERFAELSTDAYRAKMLEAQGYRAQVIEFIELEHTARNVLIRATRRPNGGPNQQARSEAETLLKQLGIDTTTLATLLD